MTTALAAKDKFTELARYCQQEASVEQIRIALGRPGADQAAAHMRTALSCCYDQPKLLECTPISFYRAVLCAAQCGLSCDRRLQEAHLVPYKNTKAGTTEVQLIIGYPGLIKLVYNSGHVRAINVAPVRVGDVYRVQLGTECSVEHRPTNDSIDREIIAAWCVVDMAAGGKVVRHMWANEINAIRDESPGAKNPHGPWAEHYAAMACKTVIRQAAKLLPKSAELQQAISIDESYERGEAPTTAAIDSAAAIDAEYRFTDTQQSETQSKPRPLRKSKPTPPPPPPPQNEKATSGRHPLDELATLNTKIVEFSEALEPEVFLQAIGACGFENRAELIACQDSKRLQSAVSALALAKSRQPAGGGGA